MTTAETWTHGYRRELQQADRLRQQARGLAHRLDTLVSLGLGDDGKVATFTPAMMTDQRLRLLREIARDLLELTDEGFKGQAARLTDL